MAWEFLKITIGGTVVPALPFPSRPVGFGGAGSGVPIGQPSGYTYTYTHYGYGNTSWPAFQLSLDPDDFDLDVNKWQPIPTFNIEQLGGGRYAKSICVINNKGAIWVGQTE